MGIAVHWDTEAKVIIRQIYDPIWNWDDYLVAFKQTRQLASEVDYDIGIIAAVAAMKRLPPNAFIYGARAIRSLPAHVALSVVVTPSRLILTMLHLILDAGQFENVRVAASVNEARTLIEKTLKLAEAKRA